MQYLNEREAGFDTERLGFPSISGCLAVCLVTDSGLFGFHNAGRSARSDFPESARIFRDYVLTHDAHPQGRHLYGCSFVGDNRRGYTVGQATKDWKGELKAFAKALGYGGPISGCDLATLDTPKSAYVEFRRTGLTCLILAKAWADADSVRGLNPQSADHQCIRGMQYTQVITHVTTTGLTSLTPVKL